MAEEEEEQRRCKLVASRFGYVLQAVLALAALLSLLFKRQTESPRRPFLVWTMDVSKQCFSSLLMHVWNIGLAIVFTQLSSNFEEADECAFYFVTFVIDTFLGVLLVWLFLKLQKEIAFMLRISSLQENGYYGNPPKLGVYTCQTLVFLAIVIVVKSLLAALVFVLRHPIEDLGALVFGPLRGTPNTELTLVMVIGPCFLNILQYWVQDNLLMDKAGLEAHYGRLNTDNDKDDLATSAIEMVLVAP